MSAKSLWSLLGSYSHPYMPKEYAIASYFYSIVFPFVYFFVNQTEPNLFYGSLTIATQVFFTFLYVVSFYVMGNKAILLVLLMFILGAAWLPLNVASSVFFIYGLYIIFYAKPVNNSKFLVPFYIASCCLISFYIWQKWPNVLLLFLMMVMVVYVEVSRLKSERAQFQLQLNAQDIEQLARFAERNAFARNLHDSLGQRLTATILKLDLLSQNSSAESNSVDGSIFRDLSDEFRAALEEMRALVHNELSIGLESEMKQLNSLFVDAGIDSKVVFELQSIPPKIETTASLIIRELVTNIIRHSTATKVEVSVVQTKQKIQIRVVDNGNGSLTDHGFGLRSIRQRVADMNGSLEIKIKSGVSVKVDLPLTEIER